MVYLQYSQKTTAVGHKLKMHLNSQGPTKNTFFGNIFFLISVHCHFRKRDCNQDGTSSAACSLDLFPEENSWHFITVTPTVADRVIAFAISVSINGKQHLNLTFPIFMELTSIRLYMYKLFSRSSFQIVLIHESR